MSTTLTTILTTIGVFLLGLFGITTILPAIVNILFDLFSK